MAQSLVEALRAGDEGAVRQVAATAIKPRRDNLVVRPWGGRRLFDYKALDPAAYPQLAGAKLGEAFELAADDDDREAREHPSVVELADGSRLSLAELLALAPEALLGPELVARFGSKLPLLPKTLNVAELLSVQAHPPGNVEAYVIIDADPGASLRLGFARDVDRSALAGDMQRGLERQRQLAGMLASDVGAAVQSALRPLWVAAPTMPRVLEALAPQLRPGADRAELEALLSDLRAVYRRVLDQLNAIDVRPGQVLLNATPARHQIPSGPPRAEVHALGNPDGKELLVLEIRRPGPTFRAWDHVRFPMREIDVESALDALSLAATTAADFEVEPEPLSGRPGVWRSVVCPMFVMDHLRPRPNVEVALDDEPMHTLHCIAGAAELVRAGAITTLARGESALIGARFGAYRLRSAATDTEVVKVTLPL